MAKNGKLSELAMWNLVREYVTNILVHCGRLKYCLYVNSNNHDDDAKLRDCKG